MHSISKLHPDLLQILTEFSDWFYETRDFEKLENDIIPNNQLVKLQGKNATGDEYLKNALSTPAKYGYPRLLWGQDISKHNRSGRQKVQDREIIDRVDATNSKLLNFFGARHNALLMFYPAGGYIGWHNNCNAPGYNIVLTCNPGGKGYFAHYDHINDKMNIFPDASGWNCKVGYFGSEKENDKIYWHCAYTDTPRLTFSYIIYDKNIWDDMVDDIDVG